MDFVSEVFRSGHGGAILLSRCDYFGPWGVQVGGSPCIGIHYVEHGRCWLRLEGADPTELRQGDVALLPHGTAHILSDHPERPAVALETFLKEPSPRNGGAPNARVVCAAQPVDADLRQKHPLMRELPRVVHRSSADIQSSPSLAPCLSLLLQELRSARPGRAALVELLLQTLLVYVVRQWLDEQPRPSGWASALRDGRIALALEAMHKMPEAAWTVESLAEVAGMSRAAFARRFRTLADEGPLSYLTRLRLSRAAQLLRNTDEGLSSIAGQVGYTSEFAFSRAFKREVGASPSKYRRPR